jgi:diguanylate cyclase (GGDEF)-like protein
MKNQCFRYKVTRLILFLLPYIILIALVYMWNNYFIGDQNPASESTQILITLFAVSIILCLVAITKILNDFFTIIDDINAIIPSHILENQPNEIFDKTHDPLVNRTRMILRSIAHHILETQNEQAKIQFSKTAIEMESIYDVLCKSIFNRSHTEKMMEKKVKEYQPPNFLVIAILDIDHFKKVNDTYGHDAGDYILKEVTKKLLSGIREDDIIGRWGGEEFCIILNVTDMIIAENILHRLRRSIEQSTFYYAAPDNNSILIPCTISIGYSIYDGRDVKNSIARADRGLYQSKENGRNRVTFVKND